MAWQTLVIFRVISAYIFTPIILKKIVNLPARRKRIYWQFFFCFLFSIILALINWKNFTLLDRYWWIMAGIGIFSALASYCYWRAVDISLSKTALFTQADDIIAILLGYLFLQETKFLNTNLAVGIIICFSAAVAMAVSHYKTSKNSNYKKGHNNIALIGWITVYSVIWGVAVFLFRVYALNEISSLTFLTSWYSGVYAGTIIILFLPSLLKYLKEKYIKNNPMAAYNYNQTEKINFSKKDIGMLFMLAVFIWISMALQYIVARAAPITVFIPIYLVAEMVLPALIGFFYFKERKNLTNIEKFAFALGMVGILVIGYSF